MSVTASLVTERFWAKVDKTATCWNWTAFVTTNGYGQFGVRAGVEVRKYAAHRLAYELEVGPIPKGMLIDHMCHNRICVNPTHLRVVNNKQNQENHTGPTVLSTSGARGVYWDKSNRKWLVQVTHNNKRYFVGRFADVQEAAEAAKQLRLSLFTHNDLDRNPS